MKQDPTRTCAVLVDLPDILVLSAERAGSMLQVHVESSAASTGCPEFIADTLQDWCRATKINTSYCDPGSPWQNGRIESFNSRLRDELLTLEIFDSMWEISFMLEEHRKNYNHYRPHSALGYMTPVEFATKWQEENAVLLSQEVDQ